ncbi:unnamed protein product [Protopolystoma xenopodis]|uniref:Neurotransmitter-gated ion-channel ligand-binding domain-containing protein n=1 Tax=Protopolystoma xenopodis TaxID=117903 RepID=A0A3S5BQZ5_9PLAT|nr:unnamed protein product [Protopolystoma xenopodis]
MFSQKITMRLGCQMNLLHFPMDKQMCYINMGSYGYTDDYLVFYWRNNDPVLIEETLRISEFNSPEECTAKVGPIGKNFSLNTLNVASLVVLNSEI